MDVREEDDICVSGNLSVCAAFVCSGSAVDRHVHRKWSVNNAACDLALCIELGQFICIDRTRHLGIDNLHRSDWRHLRLRDAARVADFDGIVDDRGLVLQCRIGHKGNVG